MVDKGLWWNCWYVKLHTNSFSRLTDGLAVLHTCLVFVVPKLLMYMSYSLTGGMSRREKVMEKSRSISRSSSALRFLLLQLEDMAQVTHSSWLDMAAHCFKMAPIFLIERLQCFDHRIFIRHLVSAEICFHLRLRNDHYIDHSENEHIFPTLKM